MISKVEIGSVIELEDWSNYLYWQENKKFRLPFMCEKVDEYKSVFYQSGRNAIEELMKYMQKHMDIKKILIPDFVCKTVTDAVERSGMMYEKYCVDCNFEVQLEEIQRKIESGIKSIYIVQYFGKRNTPEFLSSIAEWKKQGIIIVEDITMSLYSKKESEIGIGNYILGSLRKWLPIPDGAFVSTLDQGLPDVLNVTYVSKYTDYYRLVQAMKREYICGGCVDKELKENYLAYYKKSIDELFSDYKIYPISDFAQNYLSNYNAEVVSQKRIDNYDYLYNKIINITKINVKIKRADGYVPFGMLIECANRDELLKFLIDRDIYCNVHWRLDRSENNENVEKLSRSLLTIPCDQRYSYKEMDYIAQAIRQWSIE